MRDLASLDLKVRVCTGRKSNESRMEMRLISTGAFVAWFQSSERISGDELVVSSNTQIVCRNELSEEQLAAAKEWVQEQMLAI